MKATLDLIVAEYGLKARLAAPLVGRFVLAKLRAEEARMKTGVSFEPPTFYEKNAAAHAASVVELRSTATTVRPVADSHLPAAARVAS